METYSIMEPSASPASRQWDQLAAGWNENTPIIRQWLKISTDAMISVVNISNGMRVLDVAAGAGDQSLDVAAHVGPNGSVLATDFSRAILAYAASNAAKAGFSNIETLEADAENLPLADNSFDAAICRLGLMLLPQPMAGLREIYRVLKPSGRFSALVFSAAENNPCLSVLMSTALRHAGLPMVDPYKPATLLSLGKPGLLSELLHQTGFKNIVTTKMSAPFKLPSARHYINFVRDSGAPVVQILGNLTPTEKEAAWVEIEEKLASFNTTDGWSGPNELLLATGVK